MPKASEVILLDERKTNQVWSIHFSFGEKNIVSRFERCFHHEHGFHEPCPTTTPQRWKALTVMFWLYRSGKALTSVPALEAQWYRPRNAIALTGDGVYYPSIENNVFLIICVASNRIVFVRGRTFPYFLFFFRMLSTAATTNWKFGTFPTAHTKAAGNPCDRRASWRISSVANIFRCALCMAMFLIWTVGPPGEANEESTKRCGQGLLLHLPSKCPSGEPVLDAKNIGRLFGLKFLFESLETVNLSLAAEKNAIISCSIKITHYSDIIQNTSVANEHQKHERIRSPYSSCEWGHRNTTTLGNQRCLQFYPNLESLFVSTLSPTTGDRLVSPS